MSLRDKQKIGELTRQIAQLEAELAIAKDIIAALKQPNEWSALKDESRRLQALLASEMARQSKAPTPSTSDAVMKRSTLNFGELEVALVRLMGGSEDAKKAAAMVVNLPDPLGFLQTVADLFRQTASGPRHSATPS